MANTIQNGCNVPLNVDTGTVPDVGGAMLDWFQPMSFGVVTTTVVAGRAKQVVVDTTFRGVVQPLRTRDLQLKPEGQRAWTWLEVHAQPVLALNVDDIIIYRGFQCRVMAKENFTIYGYIRYELVQDWTGAGPAVVTP